MIPVRSFSAILIIFALIASLVPLKSVHASDVSLSFAATAEEQQVSQPGLIFNNAIFSQPFPSGPNYFASTRVTAGRRISYQANVTNVDSVLSPNVVLSLVIPPQATLYQGSLSVSSGSCAIQPAGDPDGSMICDLGSIPNGASRSVSFQVIVSPDVAAGSVLLAGAEASVSGDINLANNFSLIQTTVLNAADITVALATIGTVSSFSAAQGEIVDISVLNSVTAGNTVQHRVEVQNNGPSSSPASIIKHDLPAGYHFEDAFGAVCFPDATGANSIYCEVEDMGAGVRAAYDLYVSVDPFSPVASNLQNCITALVGQSNTAPPGPPPGVTFEPPLLPVAWDPLTSGNNTCSSNSTGVLTDGAVWFEETTVQADFQGAVHYAPVVRNDGRSGLLNATLSVDFPAGLQLLGGSQECSFGATSATCAVFPLSPGESQTFDIVGSVNLNSSTASGLNVTASLSGVLPSDVNSLNNTASSLTVVRPNLEQSASTISLLAESSDFDIRSGIWGINDRGDFFSFEKGRAQALLKPTKLAAFRSGTLQGDFRLLRFKKTKPNASLVFAYQPDGAYRFVRLQLKGRKGQILLGQTGQIGSEASGIKAITNFPLKRGGVYNVNLQVGTDGTTEVRINNSVEPVVNFKFSQGAQSGRAGYEVLKARTAFNTLSIVADK